MRYIDEDDVVNALTNNQTYSATVIRSILDRIPAVDVEPVRHGHWIIKPIDKMSKYRCACSACGWSINCDSWRDPFDLDETEYCPHCGAKMDEEK